MNPELLAALARQRQAELLRLSRRAQRDVTRPRVARPVASRLRRTTGWALVDIGLRLAARAGDPVELQ